MSSQVYRPCLDFFSCLLPSVIQVPIFLDSCRQPCKRVSGCIHFGIIICFYRDVNSFLKLRGGGASRNATRHHCPAAPFYSVEIWRCKCQPPLLTPLFYKYTAQCIQTVDTSVPIPQMHNAKAPTIGFKIEMHVRIKNFIEPAMFHSSLELLDLSSMQVQQLKLLLSLRYCLAQKAYLCSIKILMFKSIFLPNLFAMI